MDYREADWIFKFVDCVFKYIGLLIYTNANQHVRFFPVSKIETGTDRQTNSNIHLIFGGMFSLNTFCLV